MKEDKISESIKNALKIENFTKEKINRNASRRDRPNVILRAYFSLKEYKPGIASSFFNAKKHTVKKQIKQDAIDLIEQEIKANIFDCNNLTTVYETLSDLIKQNKQVEGGAKGDLDGILRDLQAAVFCYMASDIITCRGDRYILTVDSQDKTHWKTLQQLKQLKDSYIPCDGIMTASASDSELRAIFSDIEDSLNEVRNSDYNFNISPL